MITGIREEEIEQVVGIFAQYPHHFNSMGLTELRRELEEFVAEPQSAEKKGFFVEREGPQVIGMVGYRMKPPMEYEITWLAVRKDWQRRGVGRRLLEYLERHLKNFRCEWMVVEVPNDPDSMNFYSAMGFSESDELSSDGKLIYKKSLLSLKPTFKAGVLGDGLWR
jgi:ribosomal protein S18 acetylase RimI-like enzyme